MTEAIEITAVNRMNRYQKCSLLYLIDMILLIAIGIIIGTILQTNALYGDQVITLIILIVIHLLVMLGMFKQMEYLLPSSSIDTRRNQ